MVHQLKSLLLHLQLQQSLLWSCIAVAAVIVAVVAVAIVVADEGALWCLLPTLSHMVLAFLTVPPSPTLQSTLDRRESLLPLAQAHASCCQWQLPF